MATLSLAASCPQFESTLRAMRAMPRAVKTEVSKNGRKLAEPLAREIRAKGNSQGSHAGRVADTVKSSVKAGVPVVTAGGPVYTMGSEWGGQKRVKASIVGTSPLGNSYRILGRHTTMQFREHRGQEGYWFTPTIYEGKGKQAVMQAWADLVDDVIARM